MIRYLHRNDATPAPETDAANHERENEMTCTSRAELVGSRIGTAMGREVLADADMGREWTGIEAQDADQFTAAGIEFGSAEWAEAEAHAERAYREMIG